MLDNNLTGSITPRQGFTYRLAFTYLDYAEAVNECYDNSSSRQEALKYLNRIRERAGVRQYTTADVSPMDEKFIHVDDTQAELRRVIRAERRVELCCENNRWYDGSASTTGCLSISTSTRRTPTCARPHSG